MLFFVAVERYSIRRDPDDHRLDEVLPAQITTAHAVTRAARPEEPRIDTFGEPAMCGQTVKVVYPMRFQPDDEAACPRCASHVLAGATRPDLSPAERRDRERSQQLDTMFGAAPELDDQGNYRRRYTADGHEIP